MESLISNLKKPLQANAIYQSAWTKYHRLLKLKDYIHEAKRLHDEASEITTIDELITLQVSSNVFRSGQKKYEIFQLLSLLADRELINVMEIGTRKGGTLFLFSQLADNNARIISLDYQYPSPELKKALPYFAPKKQKIITIEGDSHIDLTLQKVKSVLHGDLLDFLFIDGDHSYEGVKKDYELYSGLVGVGGVIAFHDIVPDYHMRFGQKSEAYVGQVPLFWQELKKKPYQIQEFIENRSQDGFGIGLIIKE